MSGYVARSKDIQKRRPQYVFALDEQSRKSSVQSRYLKRLKAFDSSVQFHWCNNDFRRQKDEKVVDIFNSVFQLFPFT